MIMNMRDTVIVVSAKLSWGPTYKYNLRYTSVIS